MKNKGMPKLIEKSKRRRYLKTFKMYVPTVSVIAIAAMATNNEITKRKTSTLDATYKTLEDSFNTYKDSVKSEYEPKWYKRAYYKIKVFFRRIF